MSDRSGWPVLDAAVLHHPAPIDFHTRIDVFAELLDHARVVWPTQDNDPVHVHDAALAIAFDPRLTHEMLPGFRVQLASMFETLAERRVADELPAARVGDTRIGREVREVRLHVQQILRSSVAGRHFVERQAIVRCQGGWFSSHAHYCARQALVRDCLAPTIAASCTRVCTSIARCCVH